jgi:biopolymer transport protein ExbD
MTRFKRQIPQINSGASADIAFLLLTFFLITSSFDSKIGIYRKMPVPVEGTAIIQQMKIQHQNLLTLTIDADNQILYGEEKLPLNAIRELAKTFIAHSDIPKHVINLEIDPASTYQTYLSVLNELTAAYDELRNETAKNQFQRSFSQLTPEQREEIRQLYPSRISEKEMQTQEKGGAQ